MNGLNFCLRFGGKVSDLVLFVWFSMECVSLYGLVLSQMVLYGHVWFSMALYSLAQLCTIFVLVILRELRLIF